MSNPFVLTIINTANNPQAAGIWDFANTQMTEARGALTVLAGIIAVIIVIGVALKTKAMAATAIAIVLAGILVFVVSGGLEQISGIFGETIQPSPVAVSTPVLDVTPTQLTQLTQSL